MADDNDRILLSTHCNVKSNANEFGAGKGKLDQPAAPALKLNPKG